MREFMLIMPEVFLALTLAFVVIGEITYHGERVRLVVPTAIMGLAGALIQTLITYQYGSSLIFQGTLSVDGFSLFFKFLFIILAVLSIILASQSREIPAERRSEFCALVLASALAMCLAASAADMLLAFLSLQAVNILAYFLAGYGKRSALSIEAAVKYLAFSSLGAAFLIYGFAILFGSTHTLNLYEIHQALLSAPLEREVMLVVFLLIFLGLSFQLTAFPMHLWAPDVLEGAPTPSSAFLSFGVRAAGFAVALRFVISFFAEPGATPGQWQVMGHLDWAPIAALVSALTMLFGALLAFRQKAAKRLVAALVISQSGFLLMGLLVLDQVGVAALLFNLVTELFALMGIFYVLAFFIQEFKSDRLSDLNGVLARAVPECICLVLCLLSLVGLPPMPGFIGKFALIGAAVRHNWTVLAAIGILSIALSSAAIARLAYHLVGDFRKISSSSPILPASQRKVFLSVLMIPLVLAGVFADFLLGWAGKSLGFILW